jgi:hypothetical protein
MTTAKSRASVEVDGLPNPIVKALRRLEHPELQSFAYEKANDGDTTTFTAVPLDQLDTVALLYLETDQQITLRVDNQTDAGIVINAGGFILLHDVLIDAGAGANNLKINNNSGSVANISGFGFGT